MEIQHKAKRKPPSLQMPGAWCRPCVMQLGPDPCASCPGPQLPCCLFSIMPPAPCLPARPALDTLDAPLFATHSCGPGSWGSGPALWRRTPQPAVASPRRPCHEFCVPARPDDPRQPPSTTTYCHHLPTSRPHNFFPTSTNYKSLPSHFFWVSHPSSQVQTCTCVT